MRGKTFTILIVLALLRAACSWAQPRAAGTFEGQIEYRATWGGPAAAEYGRLLPHTVRITVRGGRVRSETLGGLQRVVSLLDADSGRVSVVDSAAQTVWQGQAPAQPKLTLSAPSAGGPIAGQATQAYTVVLTWPDPTPELPKPEGYRPRQVVLQARVAPGLRHALQGVAGGLIPLGRLPGWPLRLEGPVSPDRQLRVTLVATRVQRRAVAVEAVSPPAGYAVRPLEAQGAIPGWGEAVAPAGKPPEPKP